MDEQINRVSELLMKHYNHYRSAQNAMQVKFKALRCTPYVVRTAYQYAYDKGRADATLDAIRELRRERCQDT